MKILFNICFNGTPFWNDNLTGFPVEELPQVANTVVPNTLIANSLERNPVPLRQKKKKKKV